MPRVGTVRQCPAERLNRPPGGSCCRYAVLRVRHDENDASVEQRVEVGRRIREWRLRLRWDQKKLARQVNLCDKRARCDSNMVSRWECGRNLPGPFYQELLCVTFADADGEAVAGRVPAVDRRAFIRDALGFGAAGLLAANDGLPWERIRHALENPGRIDQRTVEGLERMTIGLERLEQQVGPVALIGAVAGHLDAMNAMLEAPMPSGLRPRVCSIASETAGLLAVAKAQAGHAQSAAVYLKLALEQAREADDRPLGAWLMGRYTCSQPAYRNDPGLRLHHFVSGAFGFGAHEASTPARAWFAAKAADIYALLGRADDCLRALDRAETICSGSNPPDAGRPRHAFCDLGEAWLAAERGGSLARLGHSDAAREAIDRARLLGQADLGRVDLWLLLAQARSCAHDQEPGEACRIASRVALTARELQFDIVIDEVRKLHSVDLARWSSDPAVVSLDEQLAVV